MDNKLTVNTGNGPVEIEVLDVFESPEYQKQYIIYKMPTGEDLYISILNETDQSYNLDNVTDPVEFEHAMTKLNQLLEEEINHE